MKKFSIIECRHIHNNKSTMQVIHETDDVDECLRIIKELKQRPYKKGDEVYNHYIGVHDNEF